MLAISMHIDPLLFTFSMVELLWSWDVVSFGCILQVMRVLNTYK